MTANSSPELKRSLGVLDATTINMGIMLASGIFLVPSSIALLVDSSFMNLSVWLVAGVFSLLGALTIAELAAIMPQAGGMFVYLREIYGPLWGFLYGWSLFLVIQTGSIAAVAVAFASYFAHFVDLSYTSVKLVAVATIVLLSVINYLGVRWGAWTQNLFTVAKLAAVLILVLYAFTAGAGSSSNVKPFWPVQLQGSMVGSFGLALLAALWCYDGWIQTCYVAGEIKNPGRNLPFSMVASTLLIIAVYLVMNFAYIFVLSTDEMAKSQLVAADMARHFIGPQGAGLIALLVMVSTFGASNGMILAGARVYYAMAKERLFFQKVGTVQPRFLTPSTALGVQAIWSCLLVFSGSYEQLFTYVIFVEFLFYAMSAAGVMVLRRRRPDLSRPYKVWGYPLVPFLFVCFSVLLLVNTLWNDPRDSTIGALLMLSGLPAYLYWRKNAGSDP